MLKCLRSKGGLEMGKLVGLTTRGLQVGVSVESSLIFLARIACRPSRCRPWTGWPLHTQRLLDCRRSARPLPLVRPSSLIEVRTPTQNPTIIMISHDLPGDMTTSRAFLLVDFTTTQLHFTILANTTHSLPSFNLQFTRSCSLCRLHSFDCLARIS